MNAQNTIDGMQSLDTKEKCTIAISSYTANGMMPELKIALNEGLDAGMTVNEIKEMLVQLYAYCGFPRSLNALGTFATVLNERVQKGIHDVAGKEISVENDVPDKYEQGRKVLEEITKTAQSKPAPGFGEFAPRIDAFLKEHLFADVFASDVLSYQQRELVTVAALASMPGCEPQLQAHLNMAKNTGITETKLNELLQKIEKMNQSKGEQTVDNFKQLFPLGEKNDAYADYFIGQSYLARLTTQGVVSANVTFEPGCRNNWHIHHKGGQILFCTAGTGWYQEEGKPARLLQPGDVVNIPAEVKHWHGATNDSWFSHIALAVPAEGATNEWLEPVSDEEYNKLGK